MYKKIIAVLLILPVTAVIAYSKYTFEIDYEKDIKTNKICDYEYEKIDDSIIMSNRSAKKCVALTFDDGPDPRYTEKILEILEEYNAKATFFVIGENAQKYPDLVLKEYNMGHEIGNHTYSHPNLKKISVAKFIDEIEKTQCIVEDITGERPKLFRPPGGYLNNKIVDELHELDVFSVLWSWRQDTKDWTCPAVKNIVSTVILNLQDGDIILFHDYNSKKSPTPEALKQILENLSSKGYSFVTISELINVK